MSAMRLIPMLERHTGTFDVAAPQPGHARAPLRALHAYLIAGSYA
ncbi:hypothetical protein [Paraburkholderia sp. Ac-20336]|nr:hypothetical protein [Paraburkholderia sp. Ac-20336]